MKKFLSVIITTLLTFTILIPTTYAESMKNGITTCENVGIRADFGTSYKLLGLIKKGTTVNVYETYIQTWLKTTYKGITGYIPTYCVSFKLPVAKEPKPVIDIHKNPDSAIFKTYLMKNELPPDFGLNSVQVVSLTGQKTKEIVRYFSRSPGLVNGKPSKYYRIRVEIYQYIKGSWKLTLEHEKDSLYKHNYSLYNNYHFDLKHPKMVILRDIRTLPNKTIMEVNFFASLDYQHIYMYNPNNTLVKPTRSAGYFLQYY